MKLLSLLELNSNQSRFKECKVGLDNDYDEIIEAFNPDFIMAEHIGENTVVLEQAIKNWSAYGLFYPDIKTIDQELVSYQFPKVFLLDIESEFTSFFAGFGKVVLNMIDYQKSCYELIYNGAYVFDW
ncbi:hypothetical protein [Acinetobacter chinensis]|uniref:hypothetical protein n=1 Tax=Acinetobacter chinensis TaxID=2004650 RepID=UPI002934302E|nr:hypothetical protein [Acinetobacter chinensis]WOE42801.1 hypothetical protein QSG87_06675 [Acinetobacter chinensis]